jgi:hypothetical protein
MPPGPWIPPTERKRSIRGEGGGRGRGDLVLKIEISTAIDQERGDLRSTIATCPHQGRVSLLPRERKRSIRGEGGGRGRGDLVLKIESSTMIDQKSGNGEVTTSQHERGSSALTDEWGERETNQRSDRGETRRTLSRRERSAPFSIRIEAMARWPEEQANIRGVRPS